MLDRALEYHAEYAEILPWDMSLPQASPSPTTEPPVLQINHLQGCGFSVSLVQNLGSPHPRTKGFWPPKAQEPPSMAGPLGCVFMRLYMDRGP